jgi:ribonuclease T2
VPSPNTTNGLPNGTAVPAYKGADIGTFLQPFGAYDLLAYMNKYWLSNIGPNADFWGHEFSKHATCYSSFQVPCYGPAYRKNEDVLDFFETAVKYYQKFPTWEWLAKYNVLPSNKTQYSISDFETALTIESGALPYVGCSGPRYNDTDAGKKANSTDTGRTVLSEVWYYTHTFGRPQNVRYVPVDQTGKSSCTNATGALWYYQPAANNTI